MTLGRKAPHQQPGAIATGQARPAAEFARANQHARRVRRLKVALPLLAGAIIVAGLAATWLARSAPVDLTVAATTIQNGQLVMEDPRMSGKDKNDRPYFVTAQRAMQALDRTGAIDLEGINANLTLDPETTAEIAALAGRYDPKAEVLRLYDSIEVTTSNDIVIRLSSADILLNDGRLEGNGPVYIQTPNQTLQSGNVTIQNGGDRLTFGNRVKLTLLPAATGGTDQRAANDE
ncbi:LPS export ABC transporter periplasmic protein LptC [Aureimonas fodinaquatilis]|uniref:LPS export ABC transporter periplasmic protein LptC n=1 Tax=Aureimonas fodinaquatilis TaxID=2565783 RepID=UPI00165D93FA|nr:LPS export ABC transporter periplasmic protein LptC [Aureimonas fodinaquatilis]